MRLLALSHIQDGKDYQQVAQYLKVTLTSVKRWLYRFKHNGLDGLKEKHRTGRRSQSNGKNEEIKNAIQQLQDDKAGGRVRLVDIQVLFKRSV